VKKRRIYLSAPMSGIPDFNRPAMAKEAERLRAAGHYVFNPGENEPPGSENWVWLDWILHDLQIVRDGKFDTLGYMNGWALSAGAQIESIAARKHGLELMPSNEII